MSQEVPVCEQNWWTLLDERWTSSIKIKIQIKEKSSCFQQSTDISLMTERAPSCWKEKTCGLNSKQTVSGAEYSPYFTLLPERISIKFGTFQVDQPEDSSQINHFWTTK